MPLVAVIRNFNRTIYHQCKFRLLNNLNTKKRCHWNVKRICLTRKYSSQHYSGNENYFDTQEDIAGHDIHQLDIDRIGSVKMILYGNENYQDEIFQKLNNCSTSSDILDVFTKYKDEFSVHHLLQSVILIWSFINNIRELSTETTDHILKYPDFEELIRKLEKSIDEMNPDELTCCLLYLDKIGVDTSRPIMQKLLLKSVEFLQNDSNISLSALSRLAVAVNMNPDIYTFLICKDLMPHIIKKIETCLSVEEIRLITICMHHLHQIITDDILNLYKKKILQLLDTNEISNESSIKLILKIINFLNFPHWSQKNSDLIRTLTLQLSNKIDDCSSKDLESLFKIFQSQLEPAQLIPKMSKKADILFEKCPTPELLACTVYFSSQNQRKEITDKVREMILSLNDSLIGNTLPIFFKILRSLKMSDIKLCNVYWIKVLNEILTNPNERELYKIARHCHRYMYFNNNLGGTYRCIPFEKKLCSILMEEISSGIAGIIPSMFARVSAFILSYGQITQYNQKFPELIVDKIESMSNQFSIVDSMNLSRGLQIALEMRYRTNIPSELAPQLLRIDNVLNNCAERYLENDLSIDELNFIVRSFNNRKASHQTNLYKKVLNQYEKCSMDFNSRIIKDISFNLSSSNYLFPDIFENILLYIVKNRDYIMGDTVQKVLTSCYKLGYITENISALHWCTEIIKRDFDYMSGLSIIQACLALSFYKAISETLINKVFTINFIQRLEEEIQTCYSKATYPERVLNQVMQLNRSICLDYPESHVPWFQQNYIEAQMTKQPLENSRYFMDIKKVITSLVDNEQFIQCNHITPYGYHIDLVLHFNNATKKIIPPASRISNDITKIAVLLFRIDSFCENDKTRLHGHEYLKIRHLEMLGFKVIHINFSDWNSMYMNVPGAKVNYIKNLLQIK